MTHHKFHLTSRFWIRSTVAATAAVAGFIQFWPSSSDSSLTPTAQASSQMQAAPPRAQAYVSCTPPAKVVQGNTMVPLSFLRNGLGASVGSVKDKAGVSWRISYFGNSVQLYPNQYSARFNEEHTRLPIQPRTINGKLYVPWTPLAKVFGINWKIFGPSNPADKTKKTVFLMQYPAAYVEEVNHSVNDQRVRLVYQLSNATRISAGKQGAAVKFQLSAARRSDVPSIKTVGDRVLSQAVIRSGGWKADITLQPKAYAPVRWFTLGNPPRLVIDIDKKYEYAEPQTPWSGLSFTKVTRGMEHGPVRLWVLRADPKKGWRLKVAPAGTGVLRRARTSTIASRNKAPAAVNGGFFAYDGAAVGAVLVNGEWIRLPWKGRTAMGFRKDGKARIGNMQTTAYAQFGSGLKIPIRDLNGWPDRGRLTALTRRFGSYYKLRAGEMAVEVKNGKVVSKPGGGGVNIPPGGFVLVASGGARPYLNKVRRGETAKLQISANGWSGYTSALGGGPRLVRNGQVRVTSEGFRSDVLNGRGPRTAFGLDKHGNYLLIVADGRRPGYSGGLTLTEMAYTMLKYGAVDAMNLDGGGSSAMYVKGRIVNRPSDGSERSVSNALLVTRG